MIERLFGFTRAKGLCVAACAALATLTTTVAIAGGLELTTSDGVTVFGDNSQAQGAPRGTLLLFHMAGSNRHEYDPLVPSFTALGFRVITIDQRSGGSQFGQSNETARKLGRDPGYIAALPDLEATLAEAVRLKAARPIIVVGSSYSAALVFLLAARHPGDVGGIAAFSPGEYLSGASVKKEAAKLTAPIYVTSSTSSSEVSAARDILAAAASAIKIQHVPSSGLHGASTLRKDSNASGAAENWAAFTAFLDRVAPNAR